MNRQLHALHLVRPRMSREPVVIARPRDSARVRRLTSEECAAEAGKLDHVACTCMRYEIEKWGCCCEAGGRVVAS